MKLNVTFLIGNGFDLACGLKTRYDDFYKWYCKKKSGSFEIVQFKKDIESDMRKETNLSPRTWSDLELGLGCYTRHFIGIKGEEDFQEVYDDLVLSLTEYLKMEEERYDLTTITNDDEQSFLHSLRYFADEIPSLTKDTISVLSDSITDYHISIYSYNYTRVLDKYVELVQNMSQYRMSILFNNSDDRITVDDFAHIHGYVDWYPVLGVDDERNVDNKYILENESIRAVLLKSKSIESLGENWLVRQKNAISRSDLICIFGMSLGEADSKTWEELTLWLDENESHHLIIFWYASNLTNTISIRKRNREIKRVQDILFDYSNYTSARKEKYRDRVHVILNSKNVFKLCPPKAHEMVIVK